VTSTHRSIALWGDDHPDLGEVAVTALGADLAIGLSAGRLPKPYWHLDPNEDASLVMDGGSIRLLAVADGHNGFDAARSAVAAVHETGQRLLDSEGLAPKELLQRVMASAADAVRRDIAPLEAPRDASRTALSVAVVTGGRVVAASYGDAAVVRVRRGRTKSITAEHEFLGPTSSTPASGEARVRPGDVIVLVTDGVTDHLGRTPLARLGAVLNDVTEARQSVSDLLALASAGGAGDHLGVALARM
jgi:serine/threonine protein phosphatase PrpC